MKHLLSDRLNKLMSQQSKAHQNHVSYGTVFILFFLELISN